VTEEQPPASTRGDFLRRRNALWQKLRSLERDDPEFEATARELEALTRLTRGQVLAGLGFETTRSAEPGRSS
jgi:hypothetical protein